jgi:aspartate/methionine/tyrosine aminotransferase
MNIRSFALERFMSRYEFEARWSIASSDCESYRLAEVLAWADEECLRLWQDLRLGYTESLGLPLLRREIASLYTSMAADDILEVVPEEGILLVMAALLKPGDHVIATYPAYQTLYGIAEEMGCEVTYWRPDEEQGWRFDPAFVSSQLRSSTRLIVVNFPHNPTGFVPSLGEFEELVSLARQADAHLFCDEMYRGLELDPGARLPSAAERYDKAVTLSGMSKAFSMPGLRVGWLVSRDHELRERLAALKDYTTICGAAPSEILALMGLRSRERIIDRNLETIGTNLGHLEKLCAARPDLLRFTAPRAGSVCFPRLLAPEGALSFCRRLVEEAGVLLLPSTVFDYGDGHVRFGLGRLDFEEGVAALSRWLDEQGL